MIHFRWIFLLVRVTIFCSKQLAQENRADGRSHCVAVGE